MRGDNFTRRRIVEWGDSDPAGLINSPRAFDFAVETIEAFYRQRLGISYLQLIRDLGLGAPVRHASCDFVAPIRQGEETELILAVERLGRSSVRWRMDALRLGAGLVFRVVLVQVFIDFRTGEVRPIPDSFRRAMALLMPPSASMAGIDGPEPSVE